MKNLKTKLGLVCVLGVMSVTSAFAATDYSSITSGIDWSSISTAIIALAATIAAVYAAARGAKMLLSFIRG